jgi:hypothetical protein
MNFANSIEIVPVIFKHRKIWKKQKRIYSMLANVYRKYFEPAPLTVIVDDDEMDIEFSISFHFF